MNSCTVIVSSIMPILLQEIMLGIQWIGLLSFKTWTVNSIKWSGIASERGTDYKGEMQKKIDGERIDNWTLNRIE